MQLDMHILYQRFRIVPVFFSFILFKLCRVRAPSRRKREKKKLRITAGLHFYLNRVMDVAQGQSPSSVLTRRAPVGSAENLLNLSKHN